MNRKSFILQSAALMGIGLLQQGCQPKPPIKGKIVGANASIGHLLRNNNQGAATVQSPKKIVIIGAGISGLSAARQFMKNGENELVILDLDTEAGGNAKSGSNSISSYPWGAHYIPVPNNDLTELLQFLQECNSITGFTESGLPIFNSFHLCFDPEERLYLNGQWQDGLIPHSGLKDIDIDDIKKFLGAMETFRQAKGSDGKYAFTIPVNNSSEDPQFTQLDQRSMKSWLEEQNFTSKYLHHYVNYCTRDDFGTPYEKTSAWAGIHYFACRKGKGGNAEHQDVLTWPEGNGFLVKQLLNSCAGKLQPNSLVMAVKETTAGIMVTYLDTVSRQVKAYQAEQCIMAVPQFIAARLLGDSKRSEIVRQAFHYSPWMVANIKTRNLEERNGVVMSWDNVIYNSPSLGYIDATHQSTDQHFPMKNLTYYLPLTDEEPVIARKKAQEKSHSDWVQQIVKDLSIIHPNIADAAEEINVMVWGHAMCQPIPGFIFGNTRKKLAESIHNKIHFAHTDLAGISIFEEAFYQGLHAANTILSLTKKP